MRLINKIIPLFIVIFKKSVVFLYFPLFINRVMLFKFYGSFLITPQLKYKGTVAYKYL